MQITIKYFGQIAELTRKEDESLEFSGSLVSELLETLNMKYNELKNIDFQVAQNQELVSIETKLTGGDIALSPPFAGG